jgi:peptidoglycan/LPS O-acetylase OafA/YrhL
MTRISLHAEHEVPARALSTAPVAQVSEKPKLHQLDVLRGICAMLLVFYHADFMFPGRDNALLRHGSLFVDFFFVLSGFIMFHNYRSLRGVADVSRFMTLRFFRIYPLHLAMLLAFLGYELLVFLVVHVVGLSLATPPFSENNAIAFVSHLALLNGFNFHFLTFNFPAWSISVEFWTYALFGVAVWALSGRRWTTIAAFAVISLIGLLFVATAPEASLTHTDDHMFARCVFGFFLGALLRALMSTQQSRMPATDSAVGTICQFGAITAAVLVAVTVTPDRLWVEFLAPPAFALVIMCFVIWPHTPLIRILHARPLLVVGTLSYSLYMVHVFVLRFIEGVLRFGFKAPVVDGIIHSSPLVGGVALVVYVSLTTALAMITYRFIEDPGRRLGRSLLERRRESQHPAAVAAE